MWTHNKQYCRQMARDYDRLAADASRRAQILCITYGHAIAASRDAEEVARRYEGKAMAWAARARIAAPGAHDNETQSEGA